MTGFNLNNKSFLCTMLDEITEDEKVKASEELNYLLEKELFIRVIQSLNNKANNLFNSTVSRYSEYSKSINMNVSQYFYEYSKDDLIKSYEKFQKDKLVIEKLLKEIQIIYQTKSKEILSLIENNKSEISEHFKKESLYKNITTQEIVFSVNSFNENYIYFVLDFKTAFTESPKKQWAFNSNKKMAFKWDRKKDNFIFGYTGNDMKEEDFFTLDYMNDGILPNKVYDELEDIKDDILSLQLEHTAAIIKMIGLRVKK